MKKITFLGLTTLALLTLTACSSKKSDTSSGSTKAVSSKSSASSSSALSSSEASSSTKASSSSETAASSETVASSNETTQGVDLTQIANGDYSSLMGTWKNNAGKTLEFTANTISQNGQQVNVTKSQLDSEGILNLLSDGFGIMIVPSGTAVPNTNKLADFKDNSDSSKNRIFAGQGWANGDDAYYKI